MRKPRRLSKLLLAFALATGAGALTGAAKTPRGPLEANDPELWSRKIRLAICERVQQTACEAVVINGETVVRPVFEEGPTPFPGPEPPKPPQLPTVGANVDNGSEARVPQLRDTPISFSRALDIYLRGTTWVTRRPNGTLRITDCPDRIDVSLVGDEAKLAHEMVYLPTPVYGASQSARTAFLEWALVDGQPGRTTEELTAAFHRAVKLTIDAEAIRAYVADAVIEAGFQRADDLLVTPVHPVAMEAATCATGRCDCAPCGPGTCDCEQANAEVTDCAPPRHLCSTWDAPTQASPAKRARGF